MRHRKSAVEQRRLEIDKQLSHLRTQLARKTRTNFTTEFRYEDWLKRSQGLIEELVSECAALDDPGEYDALPFAVVADEFGLSINKVRRLIRAGDIEATGARAHERVSREELERLAKLGPEGLLALGGQSVEQIFDEAVNQLRAGDVISAEKAYRRIQSRETLIGNYSLALEIALNLAKGRYEEADRAIKFIFRDRFNSKAEIGTHLARFMSGACFKSKQAQADIMRLVQQLDQEAAEAVKSGAGADDYQFTALYITAVVKWVLEESITKLWPEEQREELNRLTRDSIFTAVYAEAHTEISLSCREFVLRAKQRIPTYWESANLIGEFSGD